MQCDLLHSYVMHDLVHPSKQARVWFLRLTALPTWWSVLTSSRLAREATTKHSENCRVFQRLFLSDDWLKLERNCTKRFVSTVYYGSSSKATGQIVHWEGMESGSRDGWNVRREGQTNRHAGNNNASRLVGRHAHREADIKVSKGPYSRSDGELM